MRLDRLYLVPVADRSPDLFEVLSPLFIELILIVGVADLDSFG
jgi:hypothetical protein